MNNMKKTLALIGTLFLILGTVVFAATQSPGQPKFAVVNMQQVLMQSSSVAKVNNQLQDRFKPRQEKLSAQQKTLQDEMDKYDTTAASTSPTDRDAMEKKLADKKAAFMKEAEGFQKEVNEAQNQAMQVILNRLSSVISVLAKKNGYTLVLDSQAVIYSDEATDITKQVAKEFNKE
jgi:outer membrane protein